jgi:hypothetical protein
VDALAQEIGQERVDAPLPLEPAEAREGGAHHGHSEMRLAFRASPGVAGVTGRLVDDLEPFGGEGLAQPALDRFPHAHDAILPLRWGSRARSSRAAFPVRRIAHPGTAGGRIDPRLAVNQITIRLTKFQPPGA